jgi:prolyl-tRNA synthetase
MFMALLNAVFYFVCLFLGCSLMKASQFFLGTYKEVPADAELISHQLMLRAGLIKRTGTGLFTWMPLGVRVLRKVEAIIRQEMSAAGSLELLMPAAQPAELWQASGRWEQYGKELLRFRDRHNHEYCLGPTHEEVMTDVVKRELKSYKQLPMNFYQIQTKFRDEIRPRFGVMRSREFIMKDAYSFHVDRTSLQTTYDAMYAAYCRIFDRLGLMYRPVAADTGSIGGDGSHEFQVLADAGEDLIAYCPDSDYAANVELAKALQVPFVVPIAKQPLTKITTPNIKTIEALTQSLAIEPSQTLKAIAVMSEAMDEKPADVVLLVLRGDHQLNELKTEKLAGIASPLQMATPEAVLAAFGAHGGSLGPVGFKGRIVVDHAAAMVADAVVGANDDNHHYTGCTFGRDFFSDEIVDIREVVEGDLSPCGQGRLKFVRGIEVGHVFQLGKKYAEAMGCQFLNKEGKPQVAEMGCYGIGVTRVVAAAIEQNHDDQGIIFTPAMAPFSVVIVPMGMQRSEAVQSLAHSVYEQLLGAGVDVLLDDRDERPGVLLADSELIGIPHRLVIGDKGIQAGVLEYKQRSQADVQSIALTELPLFLTNLAKSLMTNAI